MPVACVCIYESEQVAGGGQNALRGGGCLNISNEDRRAVGAEQAKSLEVSKLFRARTDNRSGRARWGQRGRRAVGWRGGQTRAKGWWRGRGEAALMKEG